MHRSLDCVIARLALAIIVAALVSPTRADIFRWDNGQVIPGTEGITPAEGLNPLQQAFKDHHGLQCGFCTPGFLMTLTGSDPAEYPDDDAIRELLSGNLCRCTGYQKIVEAVRDAWGRGGA